MPDLDDLKPFLVLGLALGGVFAMSGVGLVVLYRATGVLNLAYGAIGAMGALISWSLLDAASNQWIAYLGVHRVRWRRRRLLYGVVFGPPFAGARPARQGHGDARLAAHPARVDAVGLRAAIAHSITLPTSRWNYQVGDVRISWTQIIGVAVPDPRDRRHGDLPPRHQGRHGHARPGQRPRDHGDARRARAARRGGGLVRLWAAVRHRPGCCCRTSSASTSSALTFLVIPALAAALIGQLQSLWVTLAAGFVIGIVQSCLTAFELDRTDLAEYRTMTPFVLAIVALLWFAGRASVHGRGRDRVDGSPRSRTAMAGEQRSTRRRHRRRRGRAPVTA